MSEQSDGTDIRFAMLQMTSSRHVQENLDSVEAMLASADLDGADILVLPEMFAQFGESDRQLFVVESEQFNGQIGQAVRRWAKQYNLWIVAGTVPVKIKNSAKPMARCLVVDADGEIVSHYDKIHLFDATVSDSQRQYRESDSYQAGSTPVVFNSPWGKIGLAVCYDLRFPELFRALNEQGAQLVIVPSAFTAKTGQAHWDLLCRTRAVENGYFIAAVNQCGQHDAKRNTWGHSMLVDPWGTALDAGDQPKLHLVTAEFSKVQDVRKQLPVNEHRRL